MIEKIENYGSNQTISTHSDRFSETVLDALNFLDKNEKEIKKIKKIRISLTNKCNYKCLFCHNEGLNAKGNNIVGDGDALHQHYSSTDSIRLLAEVASEMDINDFSISGGEPFLNKNILKILDALIAGHPNAKIGITSNGILITHDLAIQIAKRVNKVRINFQSPDPKKFKEMTGVNGLEKIKVVITNLLASGIKVCLNMVYTSYNSPDVIEAVQFARDHGCDLKVLELVKDTTNQDMYQDIGLLSQELKTIQCFERVEWHGNSEERFFYRGQNSNIRIIYSYCNTLDSEACATHGEVRLTPSMELNHCLIDNSRNIGLKEDLITQNKEGVKEKLKQIQEILGECPDDSQKVNFYSNHYYLSQK